MDVKARSDDVHCVFAFHRDLRFRPRVIIVRVVMKKGLPHFFYKL